MAHQRVIILLLSLTAIPGLLGVAGGHEHATLSGFPDLSDLQRDAALLHPLTVRHVQTVLFPTITFTCTGRVTSLTFMAAKPTSVSSIMTIDPQIGVWRTDGDRYRRVSPEIRIRVDQITEISPSVFTFSPNNMDFSDGDYIGLYLPSLGVRTIDPFLQEGGGPENVYILNTDPVSNILFSESSNDRNDYPLMSVQTDPSGCAEDFLTTEVLEKYVQVQVQVLETMSYEREQRLIPGINFTCDAKLNKWTVAGQIGEGSSHPQLQVWRLQSVLGSGNQYRRNTTFQLTGSDLQPRSDRNVFDFIPDEGVTISSGNILGLFQPQLDQSSFIVYYQSNSGPQNYGSGNRDTPRDNLVASSDNEEGNDYPLVTVDVTPADCATGFISADTLAKQVLFLATFADVYSQQRIIPAMNITQDGLLTKWTFAARNLGAATERTEYPELQILRLNSGDTYDIVHKTNSSEQPSRTGLLNVYEYLPNFPLRVRAGDILGFHQPPEISSRLSLAVIEGAGPPNEIIDPSSRKRQTNTANDQPLILVDIDMLPSSTPVPTTVMTVTSEIPPPSPIPTVTTSGRPTEPVTSETPTVKVSPSPTAMPAVMTSTITNDTSTVKVIPSFTPVLTSMISAVPVTSETPILRMIPSSSSVMTSEKPVTSETPTDETGSSVSHPQPTELVTVPEPTSKTSSHAPSPDSTASPSPSIGPGGGEEQSIPAVAIAGAGGGVLVAIVVLAAIVIIIVSVLRKRNRKFITNRNIDTISRDEATIITNTAYITVHDVSAKFNDIELYSEVRQIDAEPIPTEENAAYGNTTVGEAIPTEENAAYGNTTVGETIPTEENAAYGGRVLGGSHSQATTTFTAQPDELNEDTAALEYDYIYI